MTVAMYTSICLVFFIQLTFVSGEKGTCSEGWYGEQCDLKCSHTCRPLETYPCNKETGKCAEGCKSGYFGETCERKCNCSETCIQETGACIGNTTPRPRDQNEKEKNCAERKTDVWMIVAIILIVVIVLLVAFLGFILRKRSSSRSTKSSGESIKMQTTATQPLLRQSGAQGMEIVQSDAAETKNGRGKSSKKNLAKQLKDAQETILRYEKKVEELTDEHNKIFKDLGFSANSSYFLVKQTSFDKSLWLERPWLQFDGDKANIKAVNIDEYGKMANKPDPSHQDDTNSSRFINYQGTTSTSPVMKTGFTQYWEITSNIALNEPISEEMTLLDVGFSSKENRDLNEFTLSTQQYYAMRLVYCSEHGKICFHVLQDSKLVEHKETIIENKDGSTASIKVGVLLNKDIKKLTFFDCNELQLFKKMNIEYDNKLWPMFGLGAQETANSNMSISCGSDIHMTDEKLAMIKSAL